MSPRDVVVVGAGPNGLVAAALCAAQGLDVLLVERAARAGGGTTTEELTLPGFRHDVCSAVHTMGTLSPVFRALELERHGLEWLHPQLSVAHPLDDRPSATLPLDLHAAAKALGPDGARYTQLLRPFVETGDELFEDILGPLGIPRHPWVMARLGALGFRSAQGFVDRHFREAGTRALFAGCAAHSVLPLDRWLTGAFGLVFLIAGHLRTWAVARGGSQAIADALVRRFQAAGGTLELERSVESLESLPDARAYLFDLAPAQLAQIAGSSLPIRYRDRLGRFRMGPGVFKMDWALDGPIPWRDPNCARASTVHVGGTFEEVAAAEAAVWRGEHPDRPFVLLTQQSHFDPSRAPPGRHTGYAYCHVPSGSQRDMTVAIESQIERFAPGFRDRILARHALSPADLERRNPSHIGGAITGGVSDITQLFTRPVLRLNPYTTPNPRLFLCSHSTPPGGGVHGMCGFHAARTVLRRVFGQKLSARSSTLR